MEREGPGTTEPEFKRVTKAQIQSLCSAAKDGRPRGWRPYSKYPVAAAVLTSDGRIYGGPGNVECVNYTLTKHAEETAIIVAMAGGALTRCGRQFVRAMYLPTIGGKEARLCGGCRQFVWEFSNDQTVIICELPEGGERVTALSDLLPAPFGPDALAINDEDSPP